MPLETPFGFLIRFIYNLTVRNYTHFLHYYTITRRSLHSIRSSFRLFSLTLHLHIFTLRNLPANCFVEQSRAEHWLTAGNQPARPLLASSPAGTHGHIFVQCQDFCFLFLSLFLF
jgi:hypothetical protein